jgi:hypothetical protein
MPTLVVGMVFLWSEPLQGPKSPVRVWFSGRIRPAVLEPAQIAHFCCFRSLQPDRAVFKMSGLNLVGVSYAAPGLEARYPFTQTIGV